MGDFCSKEKDGDQDGFTKVIVTKQTVPKKRTFSDQNIPFVNGSKPNTDRNHMLEPKKMDRVLVNSNTNGKNTEVMNTEEDVHIKSNKKGSFLKYETKGSKEIGENDATFQDDDLIIETKPKTKLLQQSMNQDKSDIYEVFS